MNKQTLFKVFQLIKNEMDWKKNTRGCQAILENCYYLINPNHWRVKGITKSAYAAAGTHRYSTSSRVKNHVAFIVSFMFRTLIAHRLISIALPCHTPFSLFIPGVDLPRSGSQTSTFPSRCFIRLNA